MAKHTLARKFKKANSFNRCIARLVLLSFLHQNLAFATQSIIELDFKDAAPSHRLQVIPRLSNISDVDHVEIDTDQQQVTVYRQEQQTNETEDLQEALEGSESLPAVVHPILIPKHDVHNLPWELEPEKLTLFILQQTAWLTPFDEDGYKLEFRGVLLGGMFKSGGSKKELVIDVTKFTVDCKGRNDFPSGTVGEKFCNKGGNGSGDFGVQVFNKPYVPPVDKEWEKHCQKACNPFENQKTPYIPLLEDKKPELKKVSVSSLKEPIFKADDKKIHQAVGKDVGKVMQPLINQRREQFRHVLQKMPIIIMEELAPYRGGELPKKALDGIISNVSWKIDGLLKDTKEFKLYWQDGTIKLENGRWWPNIVDHMSRTGVLSAYEGLKKQYAEELEKFRKNQKIEEEKQEKVKKEKAQKEEQIKVELERAKIQKMSSPDEYDRYYIETTLLPHILKITGPSYYPAYKDYKTFITVDGTGYKLGRDINDYWQSWLNSKWGKAAKENPLPTYKLPIHLVRDQGTFDRHFIETTLLPHIRKYTSHPGYKDYQSFVKEPGTNYHEGDDIQAYMNLPSWQTWQGGAAKDFPKYQVPETCNPFYGDYEKLTRVQTMINTASWEAVYNYADKQGFTKEEVQYVNSRRTEALTFDNYMTEVFDDQVLEDWGVKDWKEAVKLIQVGKMQKIDPMTPHDYFDLEGKMGGSGIMAGGAGGGKLGWGRILGKRKIQQVKIEPQIKISNEKVFQANRSVQEYLGKDYKIMTNNQGDKIFLSNDGNRKVRFDYKYSHGDKQHIHIEEKDISGKWKDATSHHRIYFEGD